MSAVNRSQKLLLSAEYPLILIHSRSTRYSLIISTPQPSMRNLSIEGDILFQNQRYCEPSFTSALNHYPLSQIWSSSLPTTPVLLSSAPLIHPVRRQSSDSLLFSAIPITTSAKKSEALLSKNSSQLAKFPEKS